MLDELYQELILDHSRHPRHNQPLAHPLCCASGTNPLCGDQVDLSLDVQDEHLKDIACLAKGCAISVASGSLMAEYVIGQPLSRIREVVHEMLAVLKGHQEAPPHLGKLAVLNGVKRFPMRIKCATLAWHALEEALSQCKTDA